MAQPQERTDIRAQLDDLAARVARLAPSRHRPEQFFEDRSEISHELRRLAQEGR